MLSNIIWLPPFLSILRNHTLCCKFPFCVQRSFICAFLALFLTQEALFCYAISSSCRILWNLELVQTVFSPAGALLGTLLRLCLVLCPESWSSGSLLTRINSFAVLGVPWVSTLCLDFQGPDARFREFACFSFRAFLNRISLFQSSRRIRVVWELGFLPHRYHPFWL